MKKPIYAGIIISLIVCLTTCGVALQGPGSAKGVSEYVLLYEVSGDAGMTEADIILRDTDGNLLIGSENGDGSVEGETVTLPWTYEYTVTGEETVYYSIDVKNSEKQQVTTGSVTDWQENKLIDGSASFSSEVSAGDYVYNTSDDIFTTVASVDSNTQLSLRHVLFGEEWRKYCVYQLGSNITAGTAGPITVNLLQDEDYDDDSVPDTDANFNTKLSGTETVYNQTDGGSTTISSIDSATQLTLNADIFDTLADRYFISAAPNPDVSGTTDGDGPYKLIDSGATFEDNGVAACLLAYNVTTPNYAQVTAFSQTELTLDADIFDAAEDYIIFMIKSVPDYATSHSLNKLVDSDESFYSSVKAGDVIYSPYNDSYGEVQSVDGNTQLALDAEVFPTHTTDYEIYTSRTLTINLSVNGEEYDTTASTHWNELEAGLTGIITAAQ